MMHLREQWLNLMKVMWTPDRFEDTFFIQQALQFWYYLEGYIQCYTTLINFDLRQGINRLTPNDPYMGRTAPLTSKRCISHIYSTNIGTEYFKHAVYSSFFLFKMQFVS